jgi:hypothetical protein
LLTFFFLWVLRIKATAVTVAVEPVACRVLLAFLLLRIVGIPAAAEALAVGPAAQRIALTLLFGAGRSGLWRSRGINVNYHHIAKAAICGKHISMSAWAVCVVPDGIVSRLDESQVVAHCIAAGVDLV